MPSQKCFSKSMIYLVEYLKEIYETRKKKNSKYSLRSFARDLKISSGRLVTILNEKEIPGEVTLNKVFAHLGTPEVVKAKILKDLHNFRLKQKRHSFEKVLDSREISHMGNWEVWAVYTLMQREDFDGSIDWLAEQTRFHKTLISDCLACLTEIKLVLKVDNLFTITIKNVTTAGETPSSVIRLLHKQFIMRAVHSIDNIETHKRDITGITICMEPEKMEEAKLIIAEFRSRLANLVASQTPSSELHQLSVQFFPLISRKNI